MSIFDPNAPVVVEVQEHAVPVGILRLRVEFTPAQDTPAAFALERATAIARRAVQAGVSEMVNPAGAADAN